MAQVEEMNITMSVAGRTYLVATSSLKLREANTLMHTSLKSAGESMLGDNPDRSKKDNVNRDK